MSAASYRAAYCGKPFQEKTPVSEMVELLGRRGVDELTAPNLDTSQS